MPIPPALMSPLPCSLQVTGPPGVSVDLSGPRRGGLWGCGYGTAERGSLCDCGRVRGLMGLSLCLLLFWPGLNDQWLAAGARLSADV